MSGDETVKATFAPKPATLKVTVKGQGMVVGAGIACGNRQRRCTQTDKSFSPKTLTAKAAIGWRFGKWSGACSGTQPTCNVRLTAGTTTILKAVFVRK
jgi:hypothetical protein